MVGLRQLFVELKGLIENFQQFDVLLGHHQTVSKNSIIEDTETGLGGVVSDSFNLNDVELVGQLPNVLIQVNDMLIIHDFFLAEGVFHLFKDVQDAHFNLFEFFDLDIQQPFVMIADVHIGAQDNIPVPVGHLL